MLFAVVYFKSIVVNSIFLKVDTLVTNIINVGSGRSKGRFWLYYSLIHTTRDRDQER